jgi:tRNA uridine 5-carboxymethylaminomethyl modification enzyme
LPRHPGPSSQDLLELIGPPASAPDERVQAQLGPALEARARYHGYIERAQEEIERTRRHEHTLLPADFDYLRLAGLSTEVRQKLCAIRPATLGQAGRLPGVTPAAVSILLVHLKGQRRAG